MGKQTKSTLNDYNHGDRVFAKMKGWPYWPARIEMVPNELDSKDKYQVLFYGTYQTLVLRADFLLPYNKETKQLHGKERKQKSFNEALKEIENDPNLENLDNQSEKNEEGDDNDEESENEEQENEDDLDEEENELASNESKSTKSNEESTDQKSTSNKRLNSSKHQPSRRSSRKTKQNEPESNVESSNKRTNKTVDESDSPKELNKKTSKKTIIRSGRSRLASNQSETSIRSEGLETISSNSPSTASITQQDELLATNNQQRRQSSRPKQPNKRYSNLDNVDDVKSTKNNRKNISIETEETNSYTSSNKSAKSKRKRSTSNSSSCNSTLKSDSNRRSDTLEENSSSSLDDNQAVEQVNKESKEKTKVFQPNDLYDDDDDDSTNKEISLVSETNLDEKEILKNNLKEKKIREKKLAFIFDIRIEIALERMDREIKKSLRVDKTDVNRCCLIMQDLIKLPFARKHLFKSPTIIETIRKCRKFKDESVRQSSNEFLNKLHNMFCVTSEAFMNAFEKDKSNYLISNEKNIKKERIWKEKSLLEDKQISQSLKRVNSRKHSKSFDLDHDNLNLTVKKAKKYNDTFADIAADFLDTEVLN